mmetsp:Transcript_82420/g.238045  ORF Transcript_82420/g.238045 Transcript_82420/m.238045 type:complete len:265 (-) Transcript_82420:1710-2504(-)
MRRQPLSIESQESAFVEELDALGAVCAFAVALASASSWAISARTASMPSSQGEAVASMPTISAPNSSKLAAEAFSQRTKAFNTSSIAGRRVGCHVMQERQSDRNSVVSKPGSAQASRWKRVLKSMTSKEVFGWMPVIVKCASMPKEYMSALGAGWVCTAGALPTLISSGAIHGKVPPMGRSLPLFRRESPKSSSFAKGMPPSTKCTLMLVPLISPWTIGGVAPCKWPSAEATSTNTLRSVTSRRWCHVWTCCTNLSMHSPSTCS